MNYTKYLANLLFITFKKFLKQIIPFITQTYLKLKQKTIKLKIRKG